MLAYDAVTVLLTAVEDARTKNPKALDQVPSRSEISGQLRGLSGYRGVAGAVSFARTDGDPPPAGRDPVDKLVVVQQVSRSGSGVVSRFVSADGAL